MRGGLVLTLIIAGIITALICTFAFEKPRRQFILSVRRALHFPVYTSHPQIAFSSAGQHACESLSVCIVGIVRNTARDMGRNLSRMEQLESRFGRVRYFLFENDSTDQTVNILKEWKARKTNFEFASIAANEPLPVSFGNHSLERFVRMAAYRNKYVEWLRALPDQPDYVMVVDWDHRGGIDTNGVVSCFERLDWDVLCANGVQFTNGAYYDPVAYMDAAGMRIKGHSVHEQTVYCALPRLSPDTPERLPVTSAFAGLAIYRRELFDHADYAPSEPIDCEHIMLHRKFPPDTRMFVNSQLFLIH